MTRRAAVRPKKPTRRKPRAQKAEPKRVPIAECPEVSIRFLGRWVPGFHDY